jgi:hypothetical protein
MSSKIVRSFLLENSSVDEKKEYISWLKGDKSKEEWIVKALNQREKIILKQPECSTCKKSINVYETGNCYCINKHEGYEVICDIINNV